MGNASVVLRLQTVSLQQFGDNDIDMECSDRPLIERICFELSAVSNHLFTTV